MKRALQIIGGVVVLCVCVMVIMVVGSGGGGDETATKVGEVSEEESAAPTQVAEKETTEEEESAEEEEEPAEEEKYQVGDVIAIGDTVLVVLGWDIPAGDQFSKPEEGNQFVAVETLLVNQGDDTAVISSLLQMNLKDDTGQQYDFDFMASTAAGSSAPDGELAPGERVRGKIGYQVPEGASGLEFVFDASMFTSGKIFVELGAEPVTLDPPAELAGEQAQDAYAIGDMIEIGDLRMVVNEVLYPGGDDFNKPEAGNQFVAVDVTFENLSAKTKAISSLLQMELKDDTGQGYNVDMMGSAATGGSTPDGELAPGEKLRGQVGYQVPEEASGLVFVFDADIFGSGKVRVALP